MNYLFVAGVEGCGHHMVEALCSKALREPYVEKDGDWYNILLARWSMNPHDVHDEDAMKKAIPGGKITHLYSQTSFPFDNPRDPLRRPDLMDMIRLMKVPTKILVLVRDPVLCTYSAIRRGFTDNLMLQARIVEDNLIYLLSQLSQLHRSQVHLVNVEQAHGNAANFAKFISELWEIDTDLILCGVSEIKKMGTREDIPPDDRKKLIEFFRPKQKMFGPLSPEI